MFFAETRWKWPMMADVWCVSIGAAVDHWKSIGFWLASKI